MLVELKVKDFAIIDHIQMEFGAGLNIISGETGAGKSIIVRSLGLLMGAKSHAEDVRAGVEQATVEGHFDLSGRADILNSLREKGIDSEKDLVVRRVIARDGKNRVYLNGHLSSLSDLKNTVAPLVELTGRSVPLLEVTGQHDNKNLLSPHYHLDLLDQYCKTWDLRQNISDRMTQIRDIDEQIENILNSSRDRSQRLDFIKYQISEIEGLELNEEQDSELEEKIKALKSKHSIGQFYQQTREALEGEAGSVQWVLDKVLKNANSLKYKPEAVNRLVALLEEAQKNLAEASYQVNMAEGNADDEEQLEKLEARLSDLRRLQKKFGPDITDILREFEQMKQELQNLEGAEEQIAQWELQKKALMTELQPLLKNLSQKRQKGSVELTKGVNAELADLNMKGVIFEVQIEALETPNSSGQDDVLFTIRNGTKGEARPLHKGASGGELSRILLSLKVTIGEIDLPRSYLFDEVDTGISGPTAQRVGLKLKDIAQGQQVVCITHLPQVASFADQHYFISKKSLKGQMSMTAEALIGEAQVSEIARLISGEKITNTSMAHAKQLLKDAHL